MLNLLHAAQPKPLVNSRWGYLLAGFCTAIVCVFLAAPGSIAAKTHLALHGICAQRPSHSLAFGGSVLPLDARMTGIYFGAAATVIWLLAAGKSRNTRIPPRRVMITLVLFVMLLAADGGNALAYDLGLPHPYAPSNELRMATGVLCGVSIGMALGFLQAATLWSRTNRMRAVASTHLDLAVPVAISSSFGALALSGMAMLYAPFAVGSTMAAVGVFAILTTVAAALMSNRAWTYESVQGVWRLAFIGLIGAIGLMAGFSWMRTLLETWLGLSNLT